MYVSPWVNELVIKSSVDEVIFEGRKGEKIVNECIGWSTANAGEARTVLRYPNSLC